VIVRLPPEAVTQLETLSQALGQPQWRVVVEAIAAFAAARL
jgi:predicted DNA-binding protein